MELKERAKEARELVNKRLGAREALLERKKEVDDEIEDLNSSVVTLEKVVWLLQQYGEDQQRAVAQQIESVVTKGLRAVFQNQTMEFKLSYSETKSGEKKKSPEMSMSVWYEYEGELVEGSLKSSFGGGLSVVAAVLLRIVVALHLSGRVKPIILLDEALKDLSPNQHSSDERIDGYRVRMAEFLRKLVDETDVQLILVSHEEEYAELADVHHKFFGGIGEPSKVKTTRLEKAEELEDMDV